MFKRLSYRDLNAQISDFFFSFFFPILAGCQTLGQRTGWHVEQKLPYQVSGCVVASLQQPIDNVVSCRKKNYTNMMIFFLSYTVIQGA